MSREIKVNEAAAARRRVYFQLVSAADGMTPALAEAGSQPQVSTDGGSWTDAGIGPLVPIGNGRYYAELTQGAVSSTGAVLETRYKSGNTAECPGDQIVVVAADAPAGLRQITIHTQTAGGAAVPSVAIALYDAGNATQLWRGTTSTGGNVVLALDDGAYRLRCTCPGYTFATPVALTVSADATVNVTATPISVTLPSSPNLCTVYGVVRDLAGNPLVGATVSLRVLAPSAVPGSQLDEDTLTDATDANGYWEIQAVQGAHVALRIPAAGVDASKTIPAAATQDATAW